MTSSTILRGRFETQRGGKDLPEARASGKDLFDALLQEPAADGPGRAEERGSLASDRLGYAMRGSSTHATRWQPEIASDNGRTRQEEFTRCGAIRNVDLSLPDAYGICEIGSAGVEGGALIYRSSTATMAPGQRGQRGLPLGLASMVDMDC